MLAAEINLLPDKTLWVQMLLFFVVLLGLNIFVFKPLLKLIALRKAKTMGEREQIDSLIGKTEEMNREYEARMTEAKVQASRVKEAIRKEGEEQGLKLIGQAKRLSNQELDEMRMKIEAEVQQAERSLEEKSKKLGEQIAEKILGRKVSLQ